MTVSPGASLAVRQLVVVAGHIPLHSTRTVRWSSRPGDSPNTRGPITNPITNRYPRLYPPAELRLRRGWSLSRKRCGLQREVVQLTHTSSSFSSAAMNRNSLSHRTLNPR